MGSIFGQFLPIFPFDLTTFFAGVGDFKLKSLIVVTIVAAFSEAIIFSYLNYLEVSLFVSEAISFATLGASVCLVFFVFEFQHRKEGKSLWFRLRTMWKELRREVWLNNRIVHRTNHSKEKIPVLLLYGFFSSRRSITTLERSLTYRGYEVFSFNLGGLLGVFFTKGIIESATSLNTRLSEYLKRHDIKKINIVAHSKGGLVALWVALKLNGHTYCNKIITMGTPFQGSLWTWLGLVTPLGFIFKDLWQMRPGSNFLTVLHQADIPASIKIYNLYSNSDGVVKGESGVFRSMKNRSQIVSIPVHHFKHFHYISKRETADILSRLLGEAQIEK